MLWLDRFTKRIESLLRPPRPRNENIAARAALPACLARGLRVISPAVQLTFTQFDLALTHTWRIARGAGVQGGGLNRFPVVLVELTDQEGRVGLGESAPSDRYKESVSTVQEFLRQVDAARLSFTDVAGSMQYLETVAPGNYAAKCALNIALLDGAGRVQRKAVHELFGLGFTEKKHVTSFSIGLDQPEVIRRKVEDAARYPVLKLKVGGEDDEANFAALRSVAPTKTVRVDANEAWKTKEEALRRIEWLKRDGHVEFIEQPMPAGTPRADLRWLKERSPLPLFADESYERASDIEVAAECFHGVNVKLVKTAGISGAYEALTAARRAGLQTMIGCMIESSVLITAAAHLADLTNHLDIDGNILISNDPFQGVSSEGGIISFVPAPEKFGLRVAPRG
jgi:L-alanine-DL-glutamate epimerase-like enolase superfamily enzyme